ncbi:MAG TPA: WecB/TagA/CpsF family glycosyltransferase [Acidimicrobiia bacterium]|jgi:N-acetylglucosaminyldiphosphoundecaprenol N-acetyl-beta-D-mannosaminyltransferase|nr:WecB/TagA/CpsF family glycosyltransferase [Acidimicrobiia bacterium]
MIGAGHPRVDVLGVQISAVSMRTAVEAFNQWIQNGESTYVCVTGVHGVMECQRDRSLLHIHNSSGMTTPDGMPMVWASRWAGVRDVDRVYGPDLMLEICRLSVAKGWRSFFYGGKPGVADRLAERLTVQFPGLQIVGTHSPPFGDLTPSEDREITLRINGADPDIVWVGLSTPKQERWMADHRASLNARVLVGVGAAFDINSGSIRQAPRIVQRSGLEWLYRLGQEPGRLWRRYLRNNPIFLWKVLSRPPRLVAIDKAA